jgi:hypothetical protein
MGPSITTLGLVAPWPACESQASQGSLKWS